MNFPLPLVSAAAIGWIPYFRNFFADKQSAEYCRYARRADERRRASGKTPVMRALCDLLFYMGNATPPSRVFRGEGMFRDYLKKRDYRGALAVWNVKVVREDDDYKVKLDSLSNAEQVGYTPYRPPLHPFFRLRCLRVYGKGQGARGANRKFTYRKVPERNVIQFTREVKFRIGKLGNWSYRKLVGRPAPFAWMRIDYTIDIDHREFRIVVRGSSIPSQQYFTEPFTVEPQSHYYHNMVTLNESQIKAFMECQRKKAPEGFNRRQVRYRWNGSKKGWVGIA